MRLRRSVAIGKEEELAGGGVGEGKGVGADYGSGDVGKVMADRRRRGRPVPSRTRWSRGCVGTAGGGGKGAEEGGEVMGHCARGFGDEECDGVAAALGVCVVVVGGGGDPADASEAIMCVCVCVGVC